MNSLETGSVDRWLARRGLSKKTAAAVKAIAVYLALNAAAFLVGYTIWRVFSSPPGRWLELDKPNRPYVPGSIYIGQIFLLAIVYAYYREQLKRK